ncbi:phosphate ABC transporter ATP-binding protein [Actinobacteria bacterium YIM 96077]|uniref:Phosphate ABC transporter ATP-binding protein n=1 Tax=Phytoactinopolyspora halophila TaxID=1981511 RepID=A0A329QRB3_9ACTN|nr:phosphate ABC transporter ATP-binding protein [Actinobacteria bacterium YIM 96077]RAW14894.1 phosphate ABC transporter ATP-binding protein [Phytoactinopolyspora halophila]
MIASREALVVDGSPEARRYGGDVTRDEDLFRFDDVVVERFGIRALDGFTACVPATGVTGVAGPSGSGKSTVLRLCNRMEVPTSGQVHFRRTDIATFDPLALRRQVGMVFQRPTPFPGTVRDNLLAAVPHAGRSQMDAALRRASLDLTWLERDATALSGGEAQRVCMARTLITEPDVLLLDEPTSALDAETVHAFEDSVTELTRNGLAVLWVSHDLAQLRRVADMVLRIENGRYAGEERFGGVPGHEEG